MMRFGVRVGEDLVVAVRLHCFVNVLRRRQRKYRDGKTEQSR